MKRYGSCKLISEEFTEDDIGQKVAEETAKECFCEIGSVSRAEWFSAGQNGFKPEMVLTIFDADYNGEKICEVDEERYGIYRTYRPDFTHIELYLQKKAGV